MDGKSECFPAKQEPLREVVQGRPGVGKSRVIHWVCSFFTEVMHWTHGVEYVCLSSQNSMAALIGGFTVHSWGGIRIDPNMDGVLPESPAAGTAK